MDCQRRPNVYTRDRPADGLLPSRVEVGDCLASPEQLRGRGQNALAGASVAVGVDRVRHGRVGVGIVEETRGFGKDSVGIGSDESGDAEFDRFGPFGVLPQN